MRSAILVVGTVSILAGAIGAFLLAPMAVDRDLGAAYGALATGPNLVASIVWGICWALTSGGVTVGAAWILERGTGTTDRARRRILLIAAAMLLIGVILLGSLLPSGTMSNAIADASAPPRSAAELPGFVLVWMGLLSFGGGLLTLALLLVPRRATSGGPST